MHLAYIVLDDADLEKTIRWAVWGRMYNGGQTCCAAKRFIVLDAVADQFLEKFTAALSSLSVRSHRAGQRFRHGAKVDLHLEKLWSQNVTITTRLVDTVTIPMLLKTVRSKRIDANRLITHCFKFDKILDAYDTFGRAAETKALKVIIEA